MNNCQDLYKSVHIIIDVLGIFTLQGSAVFSSNIIDLCVREASFCLQCVDQCVCHVSLCRWASRASPGGDNC